MAGTRHEHKAIAVEMLDCSLVEHRTVMSLEAPSRLTGELAARLRDLRRRQGISARELAIRCAQVGMPSLTRSTIAKIEAGVRNFVTVEETAALAAALNVHPSDLLGAASGVPEQPVVIGEVPQEPPGFQPRADLLAALDTPESKSRVVVVHAVTGMRGVGKTHVAAAYARAKLAERSRLVAWINAEEVSGLLTGLAAVAAGLGLAVAEGDAEAAGRAVRHWLETDGGRCLLVFDSANDPAELQPFIPAAGAARVIITSNRRSMGNLGRSVLVDVFTEREALTFLAERTGLADVDGARLLAAELGYLPLALAQAAAVIADQHLSYETYLHRLRAMPVGDLLAPVEAGQYPRGVAAAVRLSLDGVRARDDPGVSTAVMELLTVLSPAGVRRALVHAAGRQGVLGRDGQPGELSPAVVDRALARLAGASLLTFSVDGSSVSVHRLVRRVIREQLLSANSFTVVCEAAAQLLDGVAESLSQSWYEDRAAVRDLVEQIMALSESAAWHPEDGRLASRMIRLRQWAVSFLNLLGENTVQAILMGESLLADLERVLGADHPDTLTTRANLANAYQAAGRTAEAATLQGQTLADLERVLGADHPDTLTTRANLANAYQAAGRTAEAITLLEQNLADLERVLGADHPDTLTTRNNLANAYQAAGRTAEAITLLEQNLADLERVLGADHPHTLTTRNNLANAYQAAGRTAEAITLLEQNLADRERVLGADHPHTLTTRNNLANAYQAAGRTAEAITLLEQNLADRERVLGADHPHTLTTRANLALAYQEAGCTAEAITMMSCPDCGTALGNVPVNQPCPTCGGLRRDATVFPATATARGFAPDPTIAIGYAPQRPWQQKWHDIVDLFEQITNTYRTRLGNEPVRLMVEDFFGSCRELADWLTKDAHNTQALAFVNSHPDLRLCDAIAQTTKHHTRDKQPSNKDPDPVTARITRVISGPAGVQVEIGWSSVSGTSGTEDALYLARKCMTAWQSFFQQQGLNPEVSASLLGRNGSYPSAEALFQ